MIGVSLMSLAIIFFISRIIKNTKSRVAAITIIFCFGFIKIYEGYSAFELIYSFSIHQVCFALLYVYISLSQNLTIYTKQTNITIYLINIASLCFAYMVAYCILGRLI